MTHTLDALLLSGAVTGTPAALALARAACPHAQEEMAARLAVAAPYRRNLLWGLATQCDPWWAGCRYPLPPELAERVSALIDTEGWPVNPEWGCT
ncbi:hypothetical protein [Deinococcus arenicola]|uniref:Uncharacterized protein n=1 Tax=Deinococcus arenicola TaxID=2994950 RepID=A0ABU4DUN0_9DEIO|nr:hypothetical protein [Deinococcus sp. ZS9-10]MDV6376143.1 hypothetical protein [Deinococcus sp. ZS9-10]